MKKIKNMPRNQQKAAFANMNKPSRRSAKRYSVPKTRQKPSLGKPSQSEKQYIDYKGKKIQVSDKAWMYDIHKKQGQLDELDPETRREYKEAYEKETKGSEGRKEMKETRSSEDKEKTEYSNDDDGYHMEYKGKQIPCSGDAFMYDVHKRSGELDEFPPEERARMKEEYDEAIEASK